MLAQKIENWVLLGVFWLTLLLVLVTPAITGLVGLIVTMVVLLACGLYLTIRHGFSLWVGEKLSLALVIASALIIAAFLITMRQPDDLLYLGNFLPILTGPPLLFLSRRFTGLDWTKRIILMAACGAVLCFGMAIYEFIFEAELRADGLYVGGANQFGQFALLYGTICLGGMFVWKTPVIRIVLALAAILSIVAILLAGSRGVALATVSTALVAAGFALSVGWSRRRLFALLGVVVLVAGGAITATSLSDFPVRRIAATVGQVQQVIKTGYSDEANIQIRLDLFRSGIESFVSSPLVGVGWVKSLEEAKQTVIDDPHLADRYETFHYPHLHNDMIAFSASMGLLGLGAFVLLVAAPWFGVGPNDELRRFRLFLLVTMVCIFHIFALADVSLTIGGGILPYLLMAALIIGTFTTAPPDKVQTPT